MSFLTADRLLLIICYVVGNHLSNSSIQSSSPTSILHPPSPLIAPTHDPLSSRNPIRLQHLPAFRTLLLLSSPLFSGRLWRERVRGDRGGRAGRREGFGATLSPQERGPDDRHRLPPYGRSGGEWEWEWEEDQDRYVASWRVSLSSLPPFPPPPGLAFPSANAQPRRYGPRKLYTNTPAGNAPLWEIMDLPFLSPTEFVRAKLGCNRESWDLGDISWMVRRTLACSPFPHTSRSLLEY
jgi:hypothetical protein